jgi:hypothetical protein
MKERMDEWMDDWMKIWKKDREWGLGKAKVLLINTKIEETSSFFHLTCILSLRSLSTSSSVAFNALHNSTRAFSCSTNEDGSRDTARSACFEI